MSDACQRCHGRGYIQQCVMLLDEVAPGEPQTATVIEVKDPEFCPDCGGMGALSPPPTQGGIG